LLEANFGTDPAKPFEYNIEKCPGMGYDDWIELNLDREFPHWLDIVNIYIFHIFWINDPIQATEEWIEEMWNYHPTNYRLIVRDI
jgi:hypothetical protein